MKEKSSIEKIEKKLKQIEEIAYRGIELQLICYILDNNDNIDIKHLKTNINEAITEGQ